MNAMLWTGVLIVAITYLFSVAFMHSCTGYLRVNANNLDPVITARITQ